MTKKQDIEDARRAEYIEALEVEKKGYEARGAKDRAKAVDDEISRIKGEKRSAKRDDVEKATAETPETAGK